MRPSRYLVLLAGWCAAAIVRAQSPVPTSIPIPGGERGIGFDDLRFSSSLGRLLVPGGRTGALLLVEPGRWTMDRIGGFSTAEEFSGGHDDGVTAVEEG